MCIIVQSNSSTLANAKLEESHLSVSKNVDSDRFIDTFFSSNEEGSQNNNTIVVIDKDVDDDETKSQKNKLGKKFSAVSIFNYRDATLVISEINNVLPSYSHSEEIFACWYKIYQVFRI